MCTWLCQQIKLCKAQLYDTWCSKVWVGKAIPKMGVKSCFFLSKWYFYFWPFSRYRGYYTVARGYECYVQVARTITHEFLLQEHKIHIFVANVKCSFYYINKLVTAFLMIFQRFPTTFWRFRRFSEIVPKTRWTFPNILREFLKITEDIRRFPKIAEDFWGRPEDVSMIHKPI